MFPPVLAKLLYRKEAELFLEPAAVPFSRICENGTSNISKRRIISAAIYTRH